MASGLGVVADMVITGIFPWCFTPDFYSAKVDYIQSLADFVRGRAVQPVEAFLRQSEAVLTHDAEAQLTRITAQRWSPSAASSFSRRRASQTR